MKLSSWLVLAAAALAAPAAGEDGPPNPDRRAAAGGGGTKSESKTRPATTRGPMSLTLSGSIKTTGAARTNFFSDGLRTGFLGSTNDEFVDPRLTLDLDLKSADSLITGKVRVVNRHFPEAEFLGEARPAGVPEARGGAANLELRLEEAWIQADRFFHPQLSVRAGLQNLRYELRRAGEAFFVHLAESRSPFSRSPIATGAGGRATWRAELANQPLHVDVFYLKTLETGLEDADEAIFGVNADLLFAGPTRDHDNLFNLILAGISRHSRTVMTLGAGADYHVSPYWELYSELYGQLGARDGERGQRQTHQAAGGQAGTRYTFWNLASEPWLDGSFWYLTGGADPAGKKSRDFVSYENVDTFKILEDDDYGLNIRSNYWAVKLRTGLNLKPALAEDVLFELLYGYFRTASRFRGLPSQLGHEVDLRLRWQATEALSIGAGAAGLFDSPHLEARARREGRDGPRDHAFLFYIEVVLRF